MSGGNGALPLQPGALPDRSSERESGSNTRKVGLAITPVAGSVGTQLDLPPPAIAVRNLVRPHLVLLHGCMAGSYQKSHTLLRLSLAVL